MARSPEPTRAETALGDATNRILSDGAHTPKWSRMMWRSGVSPRLGDLAHQAQFLVVGFGQEAGEHFL